MPTAWALDGFQIIILQGQGLAAVLLPAAIVEACGWHVCRITCRGFFLPFSLPPTKSPHQSPHVVMPSHHFNLYSVLVTKNEHNDVKIHPQEVNARGAE
jgi:hypothetical protein